MKPVIVYTSAICSYCHAAKRLLENRKIPFEEIGLDDQLELRQKLSRENGGYRTVPMIFIGERFVGGYTELAALDREGQLSKMLEAP